MQRRVVEEANSVELGIGDFLHSSILGCGGGRCGLHKLPRLCTLDADRDGKWKGEFGVPMSCRMDFVAFKSLGRALL